jgi:hypothetical protein
MTLRQFNSESLLQLSCWLPGKAVAEYAALACIGVEAACFVQSPRQGITSKDGVSVASASRAVLTGPLDGILS